jgi:SAM-dependent methyltransferase
MADPFGRALHDFARGEQDEPLLQIDGDEVLEHPIEDFYFGKRTPDGESTAFLEDWLSGPMLDIGAGVGRDPLYFQEQFETVAIEVSEHLVTAMEERGVEDARLGDMFSLRDDFERDRFASAHALGTQLGLVKSMDGLREFLTDLAHVIEPEGVVVLDNYDPTYEEVEELLGYRHDPTPGMAFRVMQFSYEGERAPTLLFRLFSPDRLREACVSTPWRVETIRRGPEGNEYHYKAVLVND